MYLKVVISQSDPRTLHTVHCILYSALYTLPSLFDETNGAAAKIPIPGCHSQLTVAPCNLFQGKLETRSIFSPSLDKKLG